MIVATQDQLSNKDTEAIMLLRNEIKASFNANVIDYFTISASDNYVSSLLIPRYIGKCSAIDRTDGTSVVFKEIPKDDYKDDYKDETYRLYYSL